MARKYEAQVHIFGIPFSLGEHGQGFRLQQISSSVVHVLAKGVQKSLRLSGGPEEEVERPEKIVLLRPARGTGRVVRLRSRVIWARGSGGGKTLKRALTTL